MDYNRQPGFEDSADVDGLASLGQPVPWIGDESAWNHDLPIVHAALVPDPARNVRREETPLVSCAVLPCRPKKERVLLLCPFSNGLSLARSDVAVKEGVRILQHLRAAEGARVAPTFGPQVLRHVCAAGRSHRRGGCVFGERETHLSVLCGGGVVRARARSVGRSQLSLSLSFTQFTL